MLSLRLPNHSASIGNLTLFITPPALEYNSQVQVQVRHCIVTTALGEYCGNSSFHPNGGTRAVPSFLCIAAAVVSSRPCNAIDHGTAVLHAVPLMSGVKSPDGFLRTSIAYCHGVSPAVWLFSEGLRGREP